MTEFIVNQGDTVAVDYCMDTDLTMKTVFFIFGDKKKYSKKIECRRQSITSKEFIPWSAGGLQIPFTHSDLDRPGYFSAQFEIYNKKNEKVTYPQVGYFSILVQQSVQIT